MIPERVKALFKFIEFLYDNIDNFKQYQSLINELQELNVQRNELRPRKNFKDKLKYDELQKIFHAKLDVIIANIVRPTLNKAFELNICDSDFINSLWNWNASEIHQLIEHFTKDDIDEILLHKWQYLQYRNIPNSDYYNSIFFTDLDNTLLPLFNFFKEDAVDELEAIETKTIQFSSIAEMVEQFKQGNKNVSFQLVNNEEQSTLSTNKLEQAISEHLMIPETKEIIVTPDNIHHYKYLSVKEGEHVEKRTLRNYKGKNDLPLLYAKHLHNHLKKTDATEQDFRMAEIEIINDWLNDLNKINCKSDFIPSLKRYKEFIEAKSNTENTINPLDFIRPELHTHLQQLEKRINFGGNRIRCAAFCEALKERGYFIDVKSQSTINNPIIKKFALSSYKLDITNQVKTAKKEAREAAKRRLLYLFK